MKKKNLTWKGYEYEPSTGRFYKNGNPVTTTTGQGYRRLDYGKQGKYKPAHRIAYQLMVGRIPKGKEIDHINGNITDNRIENLRLVTLRENQQNRKMHRETGKLVGASMEGSRWRAQVYYRKKKRYLGLFETEVEAHCAYMNFLEEHKVSFLEDMDKRK